MDEVEEGVRASSRLADRKKRMSWVMGFLGYKQKVKDIVERALFPELVLALVSGQVSCILSFRGVTVEKIPTRDSTKQRWCPSYSSSVAKISHEHLMNFKKTKLEMKLNDFTHNQIDIFKPSVDSDNTEHIHSELNLPFWSQCEHHLLPFHGNVHIGYIRPVDRFNLVGTSLLQLIVHFFGFKLQVQERLTKQIAEALSPILGGDITVVVEANHTCIMYDL
ncbi:hypothetical protein CXB51_021400 [Gossypium anomalum]|uniref:GTP cyclohydrolase 1 n=1 Tax=Gossypium anomalum TaxID=47600 RepID=A0A8J6CVU2_9ROSI|nr:hypothetical protein CXB51_021400 [Gossypium anomalum]